MYRCGTEMERLTLSEIGRPLRSGSGLSASEAVLTLTAIKQSMDQMAASLMMVCDPK